MRIIAGLAGRIRLDVPKGESRPTADRVRESLFAVLMNRLEGARVLDLYAGSGALGIEALSRGAAGAVFVEQSAEACATIERNLERSKLGGGRVRRSKVDVFLKRAAGAEAPYDLIFADPPYRKKPTDGDHIGSLTGSADLPRLLAEGGWLILEMAKNDSIDASHAWDVVEERRYGDTTIVILSRRTGE